MMSPYSKGSVMTADREYLVRRSMLHGYQYGSLATPPLYLAYSLVQRRPLVVNRVLRATWIGGILGMSSSRALRVLSNNCNFNSAGVWTGAIIQHSMIAGLDEGTLRNRRVQALYDVRIF